MKNLWPIVAVLFLSACAGTPTPPPESPTKVTLGKGDKPAPPPSHLFADFREEIDNGDDMREQMRAEVDAFFADHWPRYRELDIRAFEELERFPVGDHQVWVSADLVVKEDDGTVVLVDWKTGRRESDAADGNS